MRDNSREQRDGSQPRNSVLSGDHEQEKEDSRRERREEERCVSGAEICGLHSEADSFRTLDLLATITETSGVEMDDFQWVRFVNEWRLLYLCRACRYLLQPKDHFLGSSPLSPSPSRSHPSPSFRGASPRGPTYTGPPLSNPL